MDPEAAEDSLNSTGNITARARGKKLTFRDSRLG